MKIAFFDAKAYDIEAFNTINQEYQYQIKYFDMKLDENTVSLAKGYDCVCAFVNDTINRSVIEVLEDLGIKLLALRCAGYNNVDLEYAQGKLDIVRVPSYSPNAVAEHAMALVMTLNRKIHKAYNRTRENNFSISGLEGFDLRGKTVGVVGTGKIGKVFAHICQGIGMNIIAYDKYPDLNSGLTYVELTELLRQSDIISLHCPLTDETHHLINADSINIMKKGVMLINTSRGGLIDAEALVKGLKNGLIGFAGLDVYEEEGDYFFEDYSNAIIDDDILSRLLSFPNVIVTSHQAFLTKEALKNIAKITLENIKEFEQGRELSNKIVFNN